MNMLSDLGSEKEINSVPLLVDDAGAIHIAGNPPFSSRTKQIALRLFCLQELVRGGKITLHHLPTQNEMADIATKYLGRSTVNHLIGLIKEFAA